MRTQVLFILATVLDRAAYAVFLAAIAWSFGVAGESDLFFIVTSLPMLGVGLLADVCFAMMTRAAAEADGPEGRWTAAGQGLQVFGLLYGILAVGIAVLAEPLLSLLAPGLPDAVRPHAVMLQRLAALLLPAHGLATIFAAILTASDRVGVAVMRLPLINAGAALFALAACLMPGNNAGFLLGAAVLAPVLVTVYLGWQVGRLEGQAALWRWRSGFGEGLGAIMRAAFFNSGAAFFYSVILLIERAIASTIAPGAISLITVARSMIGLLSAIPGAVSNAGYIQGLATADRPPGERAARLFYAGLLAVLPFAILFAGETRTLIKFFYERGKFTGADSAAAAVLALWLGTGVIHLLVGTSLPKACQLLRLDRQMFLCWLFSVSLYTVLALWLSGPHGLSGLVLAYALAVNVNAIILLAMVVRHAGASALRLPYGRLAGTALAGGVVMALGRGWLAGLPGPFVQLVAAAVAVGAACLGMGYWLDLPGLRPTLRRLWKEVCT